MKVFVCGELPSLSQREASRIFHFVLGSKFFFDDCSTNLQTALPLITNHQQTSQLFSSQCLNFIDNRERVSPHWFYSLSGRDCEIFIQSTVEFVFPSEAFYCCMRAFLLLPKSFLCQCYVFDHIRHTYPFNGIIITNQLLDMFNCLILPPRKNEQLELSFPYLSDITISLSYCHRPN